MICKSKMIFCILSCSCQDWSFMLSDCEALIVVSNGFFLTIKVNNYITHYEIKDLESCVSCALHNSLVSNPCLLSLSNKIGVVKIEVPFLNKTFIHIKIDFYSKQAALEDNSNRQESSDFKLLIIWCCVLHFFGFAVQFEIKANVPKSAWNQGK